MPYTGQPTGGNYRFPTYVDDKGDTRYVKTDQLWKDKSDDARFVGFVKKQGASGDASLKSELDYQISRGNPYVNQQAYGDQWSQLLNQLQAQASGRAPSLAEMQYRQANMDQQAAIGSLARSSGRPGAVRAAIQQQSRLGQGLAAGSAQARLQEQLANQQMYSGALSNATNFESQRQLANASAYQNLARIRLGVPKEQTEAEKWAGYVAKGAMVAATVL